MAKSVLSTSSRGMAARLTAMKGASGSPASMDQSCEQLLAGTALAEDQHAGGQLRNLVHEIDDIASDLLGPTMNSRPA